MEHPGLHSYQDVRTPQSDLGWNMLTAITEPLDHVNAIPICDSSFH